MLPSLVHRLLTGRILHELDEDPTRASGVHEGDEVPATADTGLLVDQLDALGTQMLEGFIERLDR